MSEERKPPASATYFLANLLSTRKHRDDKRDRIPRLIDSYSADFIPAVTNGKMLTPKHYLLALGLHNLTGQKQVVTINHKLGHCISYDNTCEIETAYAEAALLQSKSSVILPLKPSPDNEVFTFYWVDNFDVTVDTQTGGGACNTTHLVAFQETSLASPIFNDDRICFQ